MPDSGHITLTAYAKRRNVSKMAVSKAVKAGRLVASVTRDETGRPWITDPELADQEWAGNTDLSKAPGYVRERAEPPRAPSPAAAPAPRPAPPNPPAAMAAPRGERPAESAQEGMTLGAASAIEKVWKARRAELDYRKEAGELVPARDVAHRLEAVIHTCRTKLLGVPSRARQSLPHLTVADITTFENLVREALEDLAVTKVQA